MKSVLLRVLPLAAVVMLAGCETTTGHNGISLLEQQYYQGCATDPPQDPACGRH